MVGLVVVLLAVASIGACGGDGGDGGGGSEIDAVASIHGVVQVRDRSTGPGGGAPVEGARITVVDEATGDVVAEVVSGADGEFDVGLASAGTFRVELDPGSLPDGLEPRGPTGDHLTVDVEDGRTREILFALTTTEG